MSRLAYVLPPYIGHLNPALALAAAIRHQGHQVVFVSTPDGEKTIRNHGFEFCSFAAEEFPAGRWLELSRALGNLRGIRGAVFTIKWLTGFMRAMLNELPGILAEARVDASLVDQVAFGASSVCTVAGIRSVVVCHTLPLHFEPAVPLHSSHRRFSRSRLSVLANRVEQRVHMLAGKPILKQVAGFRTRHQLPQLSPYALYHGEDSLTQVCQLPAFLDYPRACASKLVHTGPWINPQRGPGTPDFPWSRLNGTPVVYASMGTLQNGVAHVFQSIAGACLGLDVQLVIALGGSELDLPDGLPGGPVVVKYAPQLQLLERAALTITHAGMNTALESVAAGVPMVALPVTNDQPGVASRLAHHGLAQVIPVRKLSVDRLRAAVKTVLSDPAYRERARHCAGLLAKINGPQAGAMACLAAFGLAPIRTAEPRVSAPRQRIAATPA